MFKTALKLPQDTDLVIFYKEMDSQIEPQCSQTGSQDHLWATHLPRTRLFIEKT